MRISWRGLAFAPIPVPLLVAALFMASVSSRSPFVAFLVFLLIGGAISYGATLFMLLPSLFVLERFRRPTTPNMAALGAVLGTVVGFGLTFIMHRASGADSGPPDTGYLEWLLTDDSWMFLLFAAACGVVNSLLYHLLARDRTEPA